MRADSNRPEIPATLIPDYERIRGEYLEMPELCLTFAQAKRFMGLDDAPCREVFDELVKSGFLRQGRNGYIRHT
jgi:hypothetical protein